MKQDPSQSMKGDSDSDSDSETADKKGEELERKMWKEEKEGQKNCM